MIHPTAVIDPKAQIDSEVVVGPYVLIEGPVQISSGTEIQANAVITGLVTCSFAANPRTVCASSSNSMLKTRLAGVRSGPAPRGARARQWFGGERQSAVQSG